MLAWSSTGPTAVSVNKQLVMRVGRGIPPHCQVYQGELAEWLAGLHEPVYIADAQVEIDNGSAQCGLATLMLEDGIHSWILLPITIHEEVFGVFNVCSARAHAFGDREQRRFQALVQRACLAIENARLYENAQELAAIKERNRLARDLHDSVKQKTFAALAQIGASRRLVASQPERAQAYIDEAENLVHDVLQELVTLIREMYPLTLQEHGLADTMRTYATQWRRQNGMRVELHTHGDEKLPHETEQAFYRVFQEALANIARHSRAESVQIDLAYNGEVKGFTCGGSPGFGLAGAVYLKIVDNGCGFDPANVQLGLGLRSMRERIESLGGNLNITSHTDEGTCIEVSLPGTPDVLLREEALTSQFAGMT